MILNKKENEESSQDIPKVLGFIVDEASIARANPQMKERLLICQGCDQRERLKVGPTYFDKCKRCGCLILAKARIPFSHCPLKQW